jgi:DNA-binding IclR family transcriptional regulator
MKPAETRSLSNRTDATSTDLQALEAELARAAVKGYVIVVKNGVITWVASQRLSSTR